MVIPCAHDAVLAYIYKLAVYSASSNTVVLDGIQLFCLIAYTLHFSEALCICWLTSYWNL